MFLYNTDSVRYRRSRSTSMTSLLRILYLGKTRAAPRRLTELLRIAGYVVTADSTDFRTLDEARLKEFHLLLQDVGTIKSAVVPASGPRRQLPSPSRAGAVVFTARRVRSGRPLSGTAIAKRVLVEKDKSLVMSLRALRGRAGKTQDEIARRTSFTQSQLSRVEGRRDHLISTLRRYVRALGYEMEVSVVVDGSRIVLRGV
jgi:hypothetical protein